MQCNRMQELEMKAAPEERAERTGNSVELLIQIKAKAAWLSKKDGNQTLTQSPITWASSSGSNSVLPTIKSLHIRIDTIMLITLFEKINGQREAHREIIQISIRLSCPILCKSILQREPKSRPTNVINSIPNKMFFNLMCDIKWTQRYAS